MQRSNAILLCGGIGRRMAPIPNCNKSLLKIRGETNLIRIIKQIHGRGIKDIIVATNPISYPDVLSVLSEELPKSHKVNIVVAQEYVLGCNNVVTLKAVSEYLGNTYIIETDQYYIDEELNKIIEKKPSGISKFFTQRRTEEDWGVVSDITGRVQKVMHDNPNNEYHCLSGITYISEPVSGALREALTENPDDSIYWEELLEKFSSLMYNVKFDTDYSIEYDNISDLINKKLMTPQEVADLIDENGCAERLGSMTNTSFKVSIDGKNYALRIPGYGTDRFVDHHRERKMEESTSTYFHPVSEYYSNDAVKLTEFLEYYRVTTSTHDFPLILNSLYNLHNSKGAVSEDCIINLQDEVKSYEEIFKGQVTPYRNYELVKSHIFSFLDNWFSVTKSHHKVHRDLVPLNIMISPDRDDVKFIDWEYSGYLDKHWDLASLCCELSDEYGYKLEDVVYDALRRYPEHISKRILYAWIAVVDFVWSSWSLAKCALGEDVLDYGIKRYNRCLGILHKEGVFL